MRDICRNFQRGRLFSSSSSLFQFQMPNLLLRCFYAIIPLRNYFFWFLTVSQPLVYNNINLCIYILYLLLARPFKSCYHINVNKTAIWSLILNWIYSSQVLKMCFKLLWFIFLAVNMEKGVDIYMFSNSENLMLMGLEVRAVLINSKIQIPLDLALAHNNSSSRRVILLVLASITAPSWMGGLILRTNPTNTRFSLFPMHIHDVKVYFNYIVLIVRYYNRWIHHYLWSIFEGFSLLCLLHIHFSKNNLIISS